jgi:hypothetical protein
VDERLPALGDLQGDVDDVLHLVDIRDGGHVSEQVAALGIAVGDRHHVPLHRLPAEDAPALRPDQAPDVRLRKQAVSPHAEVPDPVLRTLVHADGHAQPPPGLVDLDLGLLHGDVEEPVVQVEGADAVEVPPQLFALQRAAEEPQEDLRRLELALDILLLEVLVPHDPDLAHVELVAFHDLEGHRHLLWRDPFLPALHAGLVVPLLLVEEANLVGVLDEGSRRHDGSLDQIDLPLHLVGGQLLGADDLDALDARLLVQDEAELQSALEDIRLDDDVFEVTQAVERLDVLAHHLGRVSIADPRLELEADGGFVDLPGPDDIDLRHERLVLGPDPSRQEEGQEEKRQEGNAWGRSARRHGRGQGLMKSHILRAEPHSETG